MFYFRSGWENRQLDWYVMIVQQFVTTSDQNVGLAINVALELLNKMGYGPTA